MSKRAIIAITLLASLGGCSLFGGGSRTSVAPQDSDISSYFDERVAAGRRYLVAGLPARAVVAFRQASYNADHAAEAYNGMGVAYSMQGRPDVAQTMFKKAVTANPYDARYSRNLARLEKRLETDVMLAEAEAQQDDMAQAELPPVNAGPTGELPPIVKKEPFAFPRTITSSGGLDARAPKETHIAAQAYPASLFSANPDGMGIEAQVAVQDAEPPVQRATKNRSVTVFNPQKGYPLRIAISGPQREKVAPAKTREEREPSSGYPVRVALGKPDVDGRN